ncbi:hypothetical protein [Halorhodospira halophila]|uniref:Uncharacterized protein n=1 Tax=Halorhodospira halophila (strain DSM 244 / SL1) TaxID=349124 RepID=A1WXB3_HALHL|nr:hypothetical protein [Halorhodospira halophila]ABM62325.1 conserved hypothetical protein [Halorhodospira halophila SL1]MBK1730074.1 hypothetical protein [Halorhodospira halophila]
MTEGDYTDQQRQWLREAKGNWDVFPASRVAEIEACSQQWREQLRGVAKPWLCWNVDPDWCRVQQRLVKSVDWTPVVGGDPRSGEPPLEEGAVRVDFNAGFNYPIMHFLFPVEFSHLFCGRLAFWHSDLLVRQSVLQDLAEWFEALPDGHISALDSRRPWYKRWYGKRDRFWELIGCTTAGASRSQFEVGAGWWRNVWRHPNCPDSLRARLRRQYDYDHGGGILAWHEIHGGKVHPIDLKRVREGHCTRIGRKDYVPQSPQDDRRDLSKDLSYNYDLETVCSQLGLRECYKN